MDALVTNANAGNAQAKDAVEDLDRWLQAQGLGRNSIEFAELDQNRNLNSFQLRAEGVTPLWIDVYASVDLDNSAKLSAYLAARRAALSSLSTSGAGHRGRLSFTDFAPIERLCDVTVAAGGAIENVVVDVWLDGKWITRVGSTEEAFWNRPCDEVAADLRTRLTLTHGDDALGRRAAEATFSVYGATAVIPDSAIPAILAADDVLLFDPEEDLLRHWSGAASQVRLAMPIDTFGAWVELQVAQGAMSYPFTPPGAEAMPR